MQMHAEVEVDASCGLRRRELGRDPFYSVTNYIFVRDGYEQG